MTDNEKEYAAAYFRLMVNGIPLNKKEREFLEGLLARMNAPERAGTVAAIIKIMLGN